MGAKQRKEQKTKTLKESRRGSTLADYPIPRDSELLTWFTTEESDNKGNQSSTATSETEEPNTEDKRFIKSSGEKESDEEYVPTDTEEFDYELSETERDFFRYPDKYVRDGSEFESKNTAGEMIELDTKSGENSNKADDVWLGLFTPPRKHHKKQKSRSRVMRQNTPDYDAKSSDKSAENSSANPNVNRKTRSGNNRSNNRSPRKHTQEGDVMGEVDTNDPRTRPDTHMGDANRSVPGGEVDTLDPSGE